MLDVSSPGISRPLVFLRQYPRNVGRTVEVTLADHSVHKGILIAADTETITVEEKVTLLENGKKKKTTVQTVIPFNNIHSTVVKVTF
jgi:ribosome maturation factor RimP